MFHVAAQDGIKFFRDRIGRGHFYLKRWRRNGAIQFADRLEKDMPNGFVGSGKDNTLQTLGNKITPVYYSDIGTGDGDTPVSEGQKDLQGANKFWKTVASVDVVYVRPNLILTTTLGYTDAVFELKEFAVRDNNQDLVSRVVDNDPLTKTNQDLVMVQWQFSM